MKHDAQEVQAVGAPALDIARVRADFPILHREVHGRRLHYLDSGATSQKPACVIEAVDRYYREHNANVHRGVHALSEEATSAFEGARETVRSFLNARRSAEIIFVRGTTEAINLVANSYGADFREGDEIIVTEMEHHSNIVPWQLLCQRSGAVLRVVPVTDEGELEPGGLERLIGPRTRMVALTHVSNALGTINPVRELIATAHAHDVPVLLDGAQAVPHGAVDVQALDCDFYTFSGHKLFGPTGIGVLYGKEALLDRMPPYQGGGDMIRQVSFEGTTFNALPSKFEAGTPHIAGAVGLAEAIGYVERLGLDAISAHERSLLAYATERAHALPGMRLIGTAREKAAILSFMLDNAHPHDIATIVDSEGVAVRAGHHCAMPLMKRFGVPATVRASMAVYNDKEDIDALFAALEKVTEMFGNG